MLELSLIHKESVSMRLKCAIHERSATLFLVLAFVAYTVSWSYISIQKLRALNASVFDLGFSMQSLWYVTHAVTSSYGVFSIFTTKGILFLLAPIYYIMSPQLLLIIQSVALGAGMFPLYGIALDQLADKKKALIVSLLYAIYFPMAGINWFDFHYQMFFIVLFLTAYYFFIKKHYLISGAFFTLSSLVRYPYYILPFLFVLFVILGELVHYYRDRLAIDRGKLSLSFAILALTSFLIISQLLFVGGVTGLSADVASGGIYFSLSTVRNGVLVFAFMLAPVLFLPLFSKKWIFFMGPFAILVFTSSTYPYAFPKVFQTQYLSMVVPFVWLGVIDTLSAIDTGTVLKASRGVFRQLKKRFARFKKFSSGILYACSLAVIIFAVVFEPYGPLNTHSPSDFNLGNQINVNQTQLDSLNHLLKLIPNNDPNVLLQNNLPQGMMNHFSPYILTAFTIGAISVADIVANRFPYTFGGNVSIDYVLGDTNNFWYEVDMQNLVSRLYESGYYKLLGTSGGLFLLGRSNISGSTYFANLNRSLSSDHVNPWVIFNNNQSETSGMLEVDLPIKIPGRYTLELYFTSNASQQNAHLTMQVFDAQHDLLGDNTVHPNNRDFNANISFDETTFCSSLFLNLMSSNFTSNISLSHLRISLLRVSQTFNPISFGLLSYLGIGENSTVLLETHGRLLYRTTISDNASNWHLYESPLSEKVQNSSEPDFIILASYGLYNITDQNTIQSLVDHSNYTEFFSSSNYTALVLNTSKSGVPELMGAQDAVYFSANLFGHLSYARVYNGNLVFTSINNGTVGWYGPYILLMPGEYEVSFVLSTDNLSNSNGIQLDIVQSGSLITLNETTLGGSAFFARNQILQESLLFNVQTPSDATQFRGMGLHWNDRIIFYGAIIRELN